jgi:uncharacterized membrane protein YqjE
MNPFRAMEIAAVSVLVLALVLFTLRTDIYPTGFAVFVLVVLAAPVWILDRARRRW